MTTKKLCTIKIGDHIQIQVDQRGSYGVTTYDYTEVDGITGVRLGVAAGSLAVGEVWAVSTWANKLHPDFVREALAHGWRIHLTEVDANGGLRERTLEP